MEVSSGLQLSLKREKFRSMVVEAGEAEGGRLLFKILVARVKRTKKMEMNFFWSHEVGKWRYHLD